MSDDSQAIVVTNPGKPLDAIQDKTPAKRGSGQPTKCTQDVIDIMEQTATDKPGATIAMLASAMGVSIKSIYNWSDPSHPSYDEGGRFLQALTRARLKAQCHIESLGLAGISDPKFNHSMFKYWTTNRFGDDWKPEQQLQHGNAVNIQVNLGGSSESELL